MSILQCIILWLFGGTEGKSKERGRQAREAGGGRKRGVGGEDINSERKAEHKAEDKCSEGSIAGTISEEDPIIVACQRRLDDKSLTSKEKTFSVLFLGSSLYTLSALVPREAGSWREGWTEFEETVRDQLLPALLQVSSCTGLGSTISQLAYIVSSQYMARISPHVRCTCFFPMIHLHFYR